MSGAIDLCTHPVHMPLDTERLCSYCRFRKFVSFSERIEIADRKRPLAGSTILWPPFGGHSYVWARGRHRVTTLCFIDEAEDLGRLSNPPQQND